MISQPGKETIAVDLLLNPSRTKGNQTIKFGQLIEYNTRNIMNKMRWGNYSQNLC